MPLARRRMPVMALAGVAFLAALRGGLVRLGWALPVPAATLPASHGPLMVTGLLGTLIGLERAVAATRWWTYGAPLLTGVGALSLVLGAPQPAARCLMAAGGVLLVAVFLLLALRRPALHLGVMTLAARLAEDPGGSGAPAWGGLGNALAMALFLVNSAPAVARGPEGRR